MPPLDDKVKVKKKPGPKKPRGHLSKHAEQPLPEGKHSGPLPSVKYERFAQYLFQGIPTREAYQKAGFAWNNGNAYRLKDDERIVKRVRELHEQAARVAKIDAAFVLGGLSEIAIMHVRSNPAASVAAYKLLGQTAALELFTEKSKADISMLDLIAKATPEQKQEVIRELSARLGVVKEKDLLDG